MAVRPFGVGWVIGVEILAMALVPNERGTKSSLPPPREDTERRRMPMRKGALSDIKSAGALTLNLTLF